jgi:hypothetical protein
LSKRAYWHAVIVPIFDVRQRASRPTHRDRVICLLAGNIPLASLLWAHGISFGRVLSFIYADVLIVPLIFIYAKYYGARATTYIVAIFYASMVLAASLWICFLLLVDWCRPVRDRRVWLSTHRSLGITPASWTSLRSSVFGGRLLLHFKAGAAPPPKHQHGS